MKIEVRGARKRFGRVEVLRGVDLDIPPGRRVALVGPNGSGKSTLIRALLGLIDCEGTVLLDGRSPYEHRVETARRLAYVPQTPPALGASVSEILALVCLTRGLDLGALDGPARALDLQLGPIARRPFRNLSGGTKQKVLLAIAFAAAPSLLVMDEPTASLDEATRSGFFALCRGLPARTTMVLCSHRLDEVAVLADHVVTMAEGRVVFAGPVGEFRPGLAPAAPLPGAATASPAVVDRWASVVALVSRLGVRGG
jgi:ABC-2 type transport system ATP-binding protein